MQALSIPFRGIFSIAMQIALCRLYSCMLHRILTLLFIGIGCQLYAQPYIDDVPQLFSSIKEQALTFNFNSNIPSEKGGHLQGIQGCAGKTIVTASSGTHAYYIVISQIANVEYARTIHGQPYRHAGGCQAAGNVFAVGIEDNIAKDKAKVLLLSTDTNAKPITIAERRGTYERSTAGATGLVRLKDGSYLVAVGDWDTKNIDFYQSKPSNVAAFDSIATYKADTISAWGSYQSINLIQQADGKLYLIGFCLDAKGSRADLFSLSLDDGARLQAISSRHFKTTKGVSFRYGAGLHVTAEKNLHIIACTRTLKKGRNYLNVWK